MLTFYFIVSRIAERYNRLWVKVGVLFFKCINLLDFHAKLTNQPNYFMVISDGAFFL